MWTELLTVFSISKAIFQYKIMKSQFFPPLTGNISTHHIQTAHDYTLYITVCDVQAVQCTAHEYTLYSTVKYVQFTTVHTILYCIVHM